MAYLETRIVIGGFAHVPVLIFIANFIKGRFIVKTKKAIETVVKERPIKWIDTKEIVVKEKKTKVLREISSKLDNIEEKANEVYEKVKKKRKIRKRTKRKIWKGIKLSSHRLSSIRYVVLHIFNLVNHFNSP